MKTLNLIIRNSARKNYEIDFQVSPGNLVGEIVSTNGSVTFFTNASPWLNFQQ